MSLITFTQGEKLTATKLNLLAQQAYDALTGGADLSGVTDAAAGRAALGLGTIATQDASAVAITGGAMDGAAIGGTTAAAGAFTTLAASSTVSGAGFTAYFASPPALGGTAPAAATLTRLLLGASGSPNALPRMFTLTSATGNPGAGTQVFRVGGNFFGALTSSLVGVFAFEADSDTMTVSDPDTMGVTWNDMGHNISTGWSGGRVTHKTRTNVTADGTGASNTFIVSGASFATATAKAGGVAGGAAGNLFARNESAELKAGAGRYWNSVVADEFDVSIEAGTSAAWKSGVKIVQWATDAVRGRVDDFAFGIGIQNGGTAPGWRTGIQFGAASGWWCFTADSTIMGIRPSAVSGGLSPVAAVGIDFAGITFGKASFQSVKFKVDGSGNLGALVASGVSLHTRASIVASTATLASVTVIESGLYDGAVTLTCSAPEGSGTTATCSVDSYLIAGVLSFTAGSGYQVGDVLTLSGGTGTAAELTVDKVGGGGGLQGAYVSNAGSYTALPTFPATLTGGSGSGGAVTPQVSIEAIGVDTAGTNYSPYLPPTITASGAVIYRPALLLPVMNTAVVQPLQLNGGQINVTGIPTSSAGLSAGDVYSNSGVLTVV